MTALCLADIRNPVIVHLVYEAKNALRFSEISSKLREVWEFTSPFLSSDWAIIIVYVTIVRLVFVYL
jgi:hypothetical protein